MSIEIVSDKTSKNPLISFWQFWGYLKLILQPYWYPTEQNTRAFSEVISSWGMLFFLLLLIVLLVSVTALESFWGRYVLNIVIEERDLSKYLGTLWVSVVLIILLTLLIGLSKFISKKIALDWYKWLSYSSLEHYLSYGAYYKLKAQPNLDYPEQGLGEEIEPITTMGMRLLTTVLEKVLQMTTFILILWTISQQVALYLIIYTIIGNLIAVRLTRQLNKINEEEQSLKNYYNYRLIHLRDHAESIAFFQGENQELKQIKDKFSQVLQTRERKVNWEKWQDIFNRVYQSAMSIFSMFVLIPLFIVDKIDYGKVSQASFACLMFSNAVGYLISEWGNSRKWSSSIQRFSNFFKELKTIIISPKNDQFTTIKTLEESCFAFQNVTLKTPDYEQVIVENLSLSIPDQEGLLIIGSSGRGKSALIRAIAGLWNAGNGLLVRPSLSEIVFLSQRPYIISGTLRQQLLYPHLNREISDPEIITILKQVNLEHLLTRFADFDREYPWDNLLSLGEQQRLAFARILVHKPKFVILDEGTSALDIINEDYLYEYLKQNNLTFISVGHRESLLNYHHGVLELLEGSGWKLWSREDYQRHKEKMINPSENISINYFLEDVKPLKETQLETPPLKVSGFDRTPRVIDIIEDDDSETLTEIDPIHLLSHQDIQPLTDYTLSTIRNKARQGQPIKTKDGLIYSYNKDPKVRKWIKTENIC